MQAYLVGGAVRDELLGLPGGERDWVVTGASAKEMLSQGYKQVGKDFPVFLHPQSNEQYALARTERKTGSGYYGFEVHASAHVTLEEDLLRRDLTINAMAKNTAGEIIDLYGGQQDLNARILRHVSAAFTEDPLRVLRVARFAARLGLQGFTIADETLQLMRQVVDAKELQSLASERIWQETQRALTTPSPVRFFSVLHRVQALPQTHPGISNQIADKPSREHGFAVLEKISEYEHEPCVRFAALVGGLYFNSPAQVLGDIRGLSQHLPLPNACKQLLRLTGELQHACHKALEQDEKQLAGLLRKLDARRKPQRFVALLNIFSGIYRIITGANAYPQANWLKLANQAVNSVNAEKWVRQGTDNKEIESRVQAAQQEKLRQLLHARGPS